MPSTPLKATTEQLLVAYAEYNSVWLVAKRFGMCGQSVHERLIKTGVKLRNRPFSNIERGVLLEKYEDYVSSGRLNDLATEMGRTKHFLCRQAALFGLTRMDRPMTSENKEAQSRRVSERWNGWTEEQQNNWVVKRMSTQFANGNLYPNSTSRQWKCGWREFGGKRSFYRSSWESNYGRYLEWLKQRGDIIEWEHEPETFWFEKIRRGTRSYLPDFRVTERNGKVVYHEVKGWMDDRSKTKLARMKRYHPTVTVILIDKRQYASVRMALGGVIPGWETNARPTISIKRLLPPMTAETTARPSGSWWSVRRAP